MPKLYRLRLAVIDKENGMKYSSKDNASILYDIMYISGQYIVLLYNSVIQTKGTC